MQELKTYKLRSSKLKTLVIWSIISIVLQVSCLYFLEREVTGSPVKAQAPVIVNTVVNLTTTEATDLQASYSKDYLAYSDAKGLVVVNVKTSQVVFTQNKPVGGDILEYHWLPDRNTLLYVSTKPYTGYKPVSKNMFQKQVSEKVNAKITELYAVDFGAPNQDIKPDKRLARRLDGFPSTATIESMDFSTYTNLIYILAKTTLGQTVYEIDVMKNMREVQRAGERVAAIVASDKKGTLYMQSTLEGIKQIVAVKQNSRIQVLRGSQYVLLGVEDGKVLLGDVESERLVEIFSLPDTGSKEKVSVSKTVEWQGSIPWDNYKAITSSGDYLVLDNQNNAVVFQQGQFKQLELAATDDYLTDDGREIMHLSMNENNNLMVTLKPI